MSSMKRNVTLVVVLLCVCAAVYLNWSYNNQKSEASAEADPALAEAKNLEESAAVNGEDYLSEYFAQARLTRQQSRDEALALLEAAATSETASQETIDGAMSTIAVMATYSMQETQIENLLLAKNFADCVAFMSAEGVTLAVPAPEEGLTAEQVAQITDAILAETDYTAAQIRIIEVKKSVTESPSPSPVESPMASGDAGAATQGELTENME